MSDIKKTHRMRSDGMSKHYMHSSWSNMMERCYSKSCKGYKNYGARGITVSEEFHSLKNFIEYMGEKPTPKHQIDRIDNNKGYERGNLRWATRTQNVNNRRITLMIPIYGVFMSLTNASEITGIPRKKLQYQHFEKYKKRGLRMDRECQFCQKIFDTRVSIVMAGDGKFCSTACTNKFYGKVRAAHSADKESGNV